METNKNSKGGTTSRRKMVPWCGNGSTDAQKAGIDKKIMLSHWANPNPKLPNFILVI